MLRDTTQSGRDCAVKCGVLPALPREARTRKSVSFCECQNGSSEMRHTPDTRPNGAQRLPEPKRELPSYRSVPSTMYFLNTDYLFWVVHSRRNFAPLDPDNRAAHLLLADYYEKHGNRERAEFHRKAAEPKSKDARPVRP